MKLVTAIIRPTRLHDVREALWEIGVYGMTVTEVAGFGHQIGHAVLYPGTETDVELLPKVVLEIAVRDELLDAVLNAVEKSARTGRIGDGKIIVSKLENAVRVRTGETGDDAL